ncbi:DUF4435 domain-containing protein [Phormidium pseudopriestleyi FRX01]|uniref:DUF4435 domain-containing protein n=1 Tax=Phormidium pseudopriestleyi FRX01 TaxID=1759528 RepID=A0ABS3FVM4_9CYAN|nr:DUF4435 domain-containing protein [Phormidium pseudopriestleyi]MBO0351039.1 DUF4435 domain-containing protein [Phormidium pseudopriestleyi FRX01]
MREHLTPDRLANKIRLMRTQYQGTFLITEGDTDARVWKNLVNTRLCSVENANNKQKAIAALDILEKDNCAGVLAVVDADFERLEGNISLTPNLLMTDSHDMETMLLQSPALEKVLAEYGSEDKKNKLTKSTGQDIPTLLILPGVFIGYLRWLSLKEGLSLKFEDLSFKKFIDETTLALDKFKLIKTVKNNSQRHDLDEQILHKQIEDLKQKTHNPWSVCCGHDLICILSIGLCKAFGSCNTKQVETIILEKDLRLAYERSFFSRTELYQAILQWEAANQPFQVLASIEE